MLIKYTSFVLFLASCTHSADILAIIPTPSYSHQIAHTNLWKQLSLRGHKVTLITTDPLNDPTLTNLTEIDVKFSYEYFAGVSKIVEKTMTMWNIYEIMLEILVNISQGQLSNKLIQDLIHDRRNFDVVIVEQFYPEYLAFAEIYKCPKILISSMEAYPYLHHKMGNPSHPILHPDLATPFSGSLNFKERVISTIYTLYITYFQYYRMNAEKQKILNKYFSITKTLDELLNDVDMFFININPVLPSPRAVGPTTINIGHHRPVLSPKPLPKDLKEFLDGANDGFIYFSLGTNVKSKDLSEETLKTIISTLRELPYKVLWKFEAETLPGKPNNVKLVKWAPQQDILNHPNIKLFITQGGLQSAEEGIYSEVPFVVIPYFADQEQNAKLMEDKGIAKIVWRNPSINKVELKNAILEVLNNPSYKNSVSKLKQLALDTPMAGLEKAIWWTEYVIRNKGAKHLRNPAADLPLYQYYLIDVISFLIFVTILVLLVTFLLVRKVFKSTLYNFLLKKISNYKKLQ